MRQNQQLIYSSTVSPGSFVIDDLYPTGYGGDLEVSVIEADGRRREFKVPFGSVPQMLREGVSRYSLTAGQVRNKLLADEPWLVQGTYQRGIGNQLTLYGGSALSDGYLSLLYGVGLSTPVGAFAADVTHARTTFDHYGNHTGASVRLSYSNMIGETGTNLTLAAYRYSTEGFYSLQDALYGRDSDKRGIDPTTRGRQRSQFQVTLNQPLGRRGGALYVTGSVRDFYDRSGTSKQYQVGYNNAWRSVNYGFSALRTEEGVLGRSDTQYLLSMSVPLGRGSHPVSFSADLGVRERGGYDNSRVGITGSAGVDNNFSYGVALSDSREGGTTAVGNAEYRSRYSALNATYSHSRDSARPRSVPTAAWSCIRAASPSPRSVATPWCWWKRRAHAMRSSATPRACASMAAVTRWSRTCRHTASTPSPSTRRAWPTTLSWKHQSVDRAVCRCDQLPALRHPQGQRAADPGAQPRRPHHAVRCAGQGRAGPAGGHGQPGWPPVRTQ